VSGTRTLKVTILGDAGGAARALSETAAAGGRLEGVFNGLGGALDGIGGKIAGLAAGFLAFQGFQALGGAIKGLVGDAQESAKVAAQLEAVLKSTGGAAGLTAADINALTDSLSDLTGMDDEAITSAQSVLLTFTNIGKNVFPDATKAILDLSAALGGDMQGATIQIGKALNDPIAGITALTRVGVSFTAQQKDMIEAMVQAGDVAGAQRLILAELAKEFGGSAEAQATNVKRLTVAWGNFREELGGALLPLVEEFAGALNTMLRSDAAQAGLARLTAGITGLAAGLRSGAAGVGRMVAEVARHASAMADALRFGADPGDLGAGAFDRLLGVLSRVHRGAELARDAFLTVRQALAGNWFGGQTQSINVFVRTLGRLTQLARDAVLTFRAAFAGDWFRGGAGSRLVNVLGGIGLALGNVVRAVRPFVPELLILGRAIATITSPLLSFGKAWVQTGGDVRSALNLMRRNVSDGLLALGSLLRAAGPPLARALWGFLGDAAGDFAAAWQQYRVNDRIRDFIGKELPKLAAGAAGLAQKLWTGLGNAVEGFADWWQKNNVTEGIKERLTRFLGGLGDFGGAIFDGIKDLAGAFGGWWESNKVGDQIKHKLTDLLGGLGEVGTNLWNNISDSAGRFESWWKTNKVGDQINAKLTTLMGDLGSFGAQIWNGLGNLAEDFEIWWNLNDTSGKIGRFMGDEVPVWIGILAGKIFEQPTRKPVNDASEDMGEDAAGHFAGGFLNWIDRGPTVEEVGNSVINWFGKVNAEVTKNLPPVMTDWNVFGKALLTAVFWEGPSVEDVGNKVLEWFNGMADWLAQKVPALATWDALGKAIGTAVFNSLPRWLQDFFSIGETKGGGTVNPGGGGAAFPPGKGGGGGDNALTPFAKSGPTPGGLQALMVGTGPNLNGDGFGVLTPSGMGGGNTYNITVTVPEVRYTEAPEELGVRIARAIVGVVRDESQRNNGGGRGLTATDMSRSHR
jgi:hypothetical protein